MTENNGEIAIMHEDAGVQSHLSEKIKEVFPDMGVRTFGDVRAGADRETYRPPSGEEKELSRETSLSNVEQLKEWTDIKAGTNDVLVTGLYHHTPRHYRTSKPFSKITGYERTIVDYIDNYLGPVTQKGADVLVFDAYKATARNRQQSDNYGMNEGYNDRGAIVGAIDMCLSENGIPEKNRFGLEEYDHLEERLYEIFQ